MKLLNRKRISLITLLLFLFLSSVFYFNKSSSIHFVDEDDNMVTGYYLANGEKLYKDVFSHHQPLTYVVSAAINKSLPTQTMSTFVSNFRMFVIFWAFIWNIFLFFKFGQKIIIFSVVFEITKIFLLGNLFLAESLSVYPLAYLILSLYENKNTLRNIDDLSLGLCMGLVSLLLLPLWPLLIFIYLLLLLKAKQKVQFLSFSSIGIIIIAILTLPFLSPLGYLRDSIFINIKYYIPLTSNASSLQNYFHSLFSPIEAVFSSSTNFSSLTIKVLSIILLTNFVLLAKKKRSWIIASFLILLFLSNIRYVNPNAQFYEGFHLLPWFSVLVALSIRSSEINLQNKNYKKIIIFLFVLLLPLVLISGLSKLFSWNNKPLDYHVNFSTRQDTGMAIKTISNKKDTAFVTLDPLVYWQSSVRPATKFIFYYGWMNNVPELKKEMDNMLLANPSFYYCECENPNVNIYKEIKRNGKKSGLFVLNKKMPELTENDLRKLKLYNFSF